MLDSFQSILNLQFDNLSNKNIYLAISGGKDSMTLCHLLQAAGYRPILLHCNFQLREKEADLDESFLANYASQHQLTIHTKKFDTANKSKELKLTIQETARNLRYEWFNTFIITERDILLTAHHLDDSIETFFINLMRGTSLSGLTGIKAKKGKIYRPLTSFTSNQIENYIQINKIKFRQDQSNFDNKYLRNQLRNQLIPTFQEKTNDFKSKVAKTIKSLDDINTWVEKQALLFKNRYFQLDGKVISVNKSILADQDPIFLEYIFKEYGIHRSNLSGLTSIFNSISGAKFSTTTYSFAVDREILLIFPKMDMEIINSVQIIDFPKNITISNKNIHFKITKTPQPFNNDHIQQLNFELVKLPITIRKWKIGDRLSPLGMTGSKLVSDILIDKKISQLEKEKILVIEDNQARILCLPEIVISNDFKLNKSTNNILTLTVS